MNLFPQTFSNYISQYLMTPDVFYTYWTSSCIVDREETGDSATTPTQQTELQWEHRGFQPFLHEESRKKQPWCLCVDWTAECCSPQHLLVNSCWRRNGWSSNCWQRRYWQDVVGQNKTETQFPLHTVTFKSNHLELILVEGVTNSRGN